MLQLNFLIAQVADVLPLDKAAETGEKATSGAGFLALSWALAIVLSLCLVAVGFKKSKRTHLD